MLAILKTVLTEAVKAVNFNKATAAGNSRLFSILCSETGSDHDKCLFHIEISSLSRGNVLSCVSELWFRSADFSFRGHLRLRQLLCFRDCSTWQLYFAASVS
jgi:hypothetical protein